jgi:uncharacterized protein (TIGR00369 family)
MKRMETTEAERPASTIPTGFAPMKLKSPFARSIGEFFVHESRPVVATRVTGDQLNSIGFAHGGFLATLADSACGVILQRDLKLSTAPATVSLNIDYIATVHEGDWVEAHVEVHKVGGRLTNASCLLKVGEHLVLRSSGIFVMTRARV